MIKYSLMLGLATLLLMATRCDKPQAIAPGETFTLAPGQSAACKDCKLAITFKGVSEDSRCPTYTNCVWEGQAVVQLMLHAENSDAGDMVNLTLRGPNTQKASLSHRGYRLQVEALDPYPESGKKIAPTDYRLKMVLQKE